MRAEYMPPERALDPVIQDPHALVQCRANPDALWVQHQNGVFRSTDRGLSWQEIDGAVSGSASPWPCTRAKAKRRGSCPP
jgi:hypothetical protein